MYRDGWRATLLAREALVNVTSWRSRTAVLAVLAVLIGALCPLFIARESVALAAQLESLAAEGRGVVTFGSLSAETPTAITRGSCEHLVDADGVERSGLLYYPNPDKGEVATADVPELGGNTSIVRASGTLFPELRQYGALVGSAIGTHTAPTAISIDGEAVQAAPLARQPEGVSANSALVLPLEAATTSGDTCIAVLSPAVDAAELIPTLHSRLDILDNPAQGREELTEMLDPLALYQDRVTRFLPLLLAGVAAVTAAILNQLRASEFAAYRMSGTSRRSLAIIVMLEQALLTGIGMTAAIAATYVVRDQLLSVAASAYWCFAAFSLWWALAVTLSIPILMRRPSRLAKDR